VVVSSLSHLHHKVQVCIDNQTSGKQTVVLIIKQDKENLPRHHLAYSLALNSSNNNQVCMIELSPLLNISKVASSHQSNLTTRSRDLTSQYKFKRTEFNKNHHMHLECFNRKKQENRNYMVQTHFKDLDNLCTMCTKMNNHP
jgi:hypothetical protein